MPLSWESRRALGHIVRGSIGLDLFGNGATVGIAVEEVDEGEHTGKGCGHRDLNPSYRLGKPM
jgi:hypothetical protein